MKFILGLALIVLSISTWAAQGWQTTGGAIKFTLPMQGDYRAYLARQRNPINENRIYNSNEMCPNISKSVYQIYETIVVKNNLAAFINEGPGMDLRLNCSITTPTAYGTRTEPGNRIVLSVYDIHFADSADELAFAMAHEISHALLGHVNRRQQSSAPDAILQDENAADQFAITLMINAGYNPRAAISFLRKLATGYHTYRRILGVVVVDPTSNHGTVESRVELIQTAIKTLSGTSMAPPERNIDMRTFKGEYKNLEKKYQRI